MKAKLNFRGKKIEIQDIEKVSGFKKYTGLMFKSQEINALLFDFEQETSQAIHSFFCPDFLAIWLDKNNKIIEYKLITPNRTYIKPEKKFTKLLEVPLNDKYKEVIKLFLDNKKKDLNTTSS